MKDKKTKIKKLKIIYSIFFPVIILGAVGYGSYFFITNNKFQKNETITNNSNISYVRDPYGASFKIKDSANDVSFVSIFSHFDAPGVNKNVNNLNQKEEESSIDGQGTQEVKEAQNISTALDTFKKYFSTENIIFMGDTNIKLDNQAKAFSNLKNYSMLFKDEKKYATTLSTTTNTFANPYDKIIYSFDNNLSISNSNYSDINDVKKQNYDASSGFAINTFLTLPSSVYYGGKGWIDYSSTYYKSSIYDYVKYLVSDHLPVGTDLNYTATNNTQSKIRVGEWNVENFSFPSKNINSMYINQNNVSKKNAHAINVAKIINHTGYDLIGLIEINKDSTESDLQNFLNYLNYLNVDSNGVVTKKYSAVLSENTPSVNINSEMVEQVLILYNSNVLELNNNPAPAFYTSDLNSPEPPADVESYAFQINNNLVFRNYY